MRRRPNLLYIFTDEQAARTLSAYGNDLIDTPNLDGLARESFLFENAYVTQPVCTPSRSSLMTGLYPHQNGCMANNVPLSSATGCFPELGDFTNYRRAYFGKWHLGDEVFAQHGFDEWISVEDQYRAYYSSGRDPRTQSSYTAHLRSLGYTPDIRESDGFEYFSRAFSLRLDEKHTKPHFLADRACEFLRQNSEDPFLLFVNFLEPHMPFFGPRDGQYPLPDIPLPESFYQEMDDRVPAYVRHLRELQYHEGSKNSDLPLQTEEHWRRLISNYYGLVSLVDSAVGRVLSTLQELGLAEDTIVVFTSDHGDMMGAHRLFAKGVMYEEAISVPLMIRYPQGPFTPGRVSAPVSQIDLLPTLLDAMGQDVPTDLPGVSWIPDLVAGRDPQRDVFVEWTSPAVAGAWHEEQLPHDEPVRTVITPEGWKLNRRRHDVNELFNLRSDPNELDNLSDRDGYRKQEVELARRIDDWKRRTDDGIEV